MTSKKLVIVPTAPPKTEPDSWRYHAYTKRDGRLYFNRLEIDKGQARLLRITFRIYYRDEAHGNVNATNLAIREEVFSVDDALFRTIDRTRWEVSVHLPQASVTKIGAKLDTNTGETAWLYVYPAGTDSLQVMEAPEVGEGLPPIRTMGHKQYQFAVRAVPPVPPGASAMSLLNAFEETKATEPQTFFRAYADVSNAHAKGENPPVDVPGTVSQFEPLDFDATATLTLPPDTSGTFKLRVTGDAEVSMNVTAGSLETLMNAINADALFGGYFIADIPEEESEFVRLRPRLNYVGTLSATGALVADGFTLGETALNIQVGRKYTVMASGGGGVSEQSSMSITTGPVQAASKIVIHGIPDGTSEDVATLLICAAADGTDGPFGQVTSCAPGATTATDMYVEGVAMVETPASCETRDGHVDIVVKRGSTEWFTLQIPANEQRSNIVTALGRIEEGVTISAEIQYELDQAPTLEEPGRPNDVRVVIE